MTPHALIAPARLAGQPLLRTQSDERLVDLTRAGNDGAFEAIVARYRRPLLRYASKILAEGRAEDAVQQAFLRAYDSLRASEGEMQLKPWLYRIVHNCSLNALRDRSLDHDELSESIDGVERPDQAFEKHQRLNDVVAAVSALPERQRDAIVLRELEGRSYEEIALELGVTGGAVRQLLNRARTSLRSGMTAVTPFGLLARLPWADSGDAMSSRVAEICAGGAGSAILAKACATVIVTGAVVGGVATSPSNGPGEPEARTPDAQAATTPRPSGDDPGGPRSPGAGGGVSGDRHRGGSGHERRGGRRHGGDEPGDDRGSSGRSGSGHGGGGDDGSGSDDHSGSGGGGSGDDRGGSGSDDSGSGGSGGSDDGGSSGSGSGAGSGSGGGGADDPAGTETSGGGDGSGSSGSSGSGSGEDISGGDGTSGKGGDDTTRTLTTGD
jgi:RNA polymerase sigma factor (sigma-70 family)